MSTDFAMGAEVPFDPFTMDDIDPDRPGSGGGGRLPEGGYRLAVTEVIVKNERGSTQIECEVVAAKDENMLGRKHTEYLTWPDAEHSPEYNKIKKEQLLAWCYAAKTTSPEEIRQRQAAKQGFDIRWLESMLGRQVLAFIKIDKWKGNDGEEKSAAKIDGRVWAVDNPKGKDIPGYVAASSPTTTATQQQAPPAQTKNEFEGLV